MNFSLANSNKPKNSQTADPSKYPQGYFKEKPCRRCGKIFAPKAPSELYCCEECRQEAIESRYLEKSYGITIDEYKDLQNAQNFKCAICGSEGWVMDESRHKAKLALDHDHKTGAVRGLLCHNCNRALGLFQDSISNLENAIDYLKRATTIPKGSTPKQVEKVGTITSEDIV